MSAPLSTRTINIVVLDAEPTVPVVCAKQGLYSDIFHALLSDAALRNSKTSPSIAIKTTGYDCTKLLYPSSSVLESLDAILLTGSSHGAYDQVEWVLELQRWVRDIYERYPKIKLFGTCFGHQLLSQALLAQHGIYVEPSPVGWEVGTHSVSLNPEFVSHFTSSSQEINPTATTTDATDSIRLNLIHADHVVIPSQGLPAGWVAVGSTPKCATQGVFLPGRVLTLQAHPEYDRFITVETLKAVGREVWSDEVLEEQIKSAGEDAELERIADLILEFILR